MRRSLRAAATAPSVERTDPACDTLSYLGNCYTGDVQSLALKDTDHRTWPENKAALQKEIRQKNVHRKEMHENEEKRRRDKRLARKSVI